jgi:hypothetical protein
MEKEGRVTALPNPHSNKRTDIGEGLLKAILSQAGITHSEWLGHEKEGKSDDRDSGRPDENAD